MTVLRWLDVVLEGTKQAVLDTKKMLSNLLYELCIAAVPHGFRSSSLAGADRAP